MPRCYLLACAVSSSLDQTSNNVSLFQLVEQVNVAPDAPRPGSGQLPVEIHAYFQVDHQELGADWELRYVLVSPTGLETSSEIFRHRVVTPRFRTRTLGLPIPPVNGHYVIAVDFRRHGEESFRRDPLTWPVSFVEVRREPTVTH